MLSELKWKNFVLPFFLFLISFVTYVHNISSSVYAGDVGDIVTAIAVKGIPHPSGYPLFTLLGILFDSLPIHATHAWKVGLLSSVSASIAVVVMYFLIIRLTKNLLISVITALFLAFFYGFWLYAEIGELFAFNNLIFLSLLYCSLSYYLTKNKRFLYIFSFLFGLSLSHHHIISLFVPSFAILILSTNWKIIKSPKILITCLALVLFGLLPYLYIPLAASHNPAINWDHASNLNNFIRLVLRLDYGVTPGVGVDTLTRFLTVKTYFLWILIQLTPAGVICMTLGMIALLLKKKYILVISLFLAFFITGPFFIFYTGTQLTSVFTHSVLERFYMISAIILIIFFPFGILLISEVLSQVIISITKINRPKSYYLTIFSLLFFILPLSLFKNNFSKTDLHAVWTGDYLAQDIFSPLKENAILFVNGDTVLFNTWYLRYANNYRQDVTIVNLFGLTNSDEYVKEKNTVIRTTKNLPKEMVDVKTITSFALTKPVYTLIGIQYPEKKYGTLTWIPFGLVQKLADKSDLQSSEEMYLTKTDSIWRKYHIPVRGAQENLAAHGLSISDIPIYYAQGAVNTGNYLASRYKDLEKAKVYYQKAIEIDPNASGGYYGLGYYYFNNLDCKNSEDNFKKAIENSLGAKDAYLLLYATYGSCFHDNKKARQVADQFYSLYHQNLLDVLKEEVNKIK